jgi:hypothetical protein
MKFLDALFGQPTAFTYRRNRFYNLNIDNAAANSFEVPLHQRTPPFEPEDGQGRTWGGQHVRMDLYLTAPGLLTLQRMTPIFDFEQMDAGETEDYSPSVEAAQIE